MYTLPTLYKKTSTGKIQYWKIAVLSGDQIHTAYGQVGGKEQTTIDFISEGKNIGKKNETSIQQQAEAEALAKWQKQLKKGYVESVEGAQAEETDALIEGGIVPMLAHKFADHSHKIVYPAFIQPKLDGIRCIAVVRSGKCTLWSRTRKPITSMPHIQKTLETIFQDSDVILDGELFHNNINVRPFKVFDIKGQKVFIDQEDLPKLQGYAVQIAANGYPVVSIKREPQYVHRLVMGSPENSIDHIDGNKLDARKSNLRICNMSQNIANTSKRLTNTSGYKGVVFFKRDNNWHAQITKDYKKIHIGYFSTAEAAAKAYDEKAIELFGQFAVLNFPLQVLKTFEDLVSGVKAEEPNEFSNQVQYHIYDIVTEEPFSKRTNKLRDFEKLWAKSHIVRVETINIEDEEQMLTHFNKWRARGYEGAMIRNSDSLYENKRSYGLQKIKDFSDDEFPIIGIEEGRGRLSGHVGAFVCKTAEGKEFQVKMSGDVTKLKEYFENHALWQGKKITVKYQGITNKEQVPRFPVGIAIRDYE